METLKLRFQYTQSEYIKAERQYLISSKTIHKYDIALVTLFLLLSVVYILFSSFSVFSILTPLYNFSIKNVIQGFLMYNKFANKKIRKKVILYDKLIIQRKNYNW